MQKKTNYLNRMSDLINPLLNRSGMIINSPFEYLATKKRLMIVGFNPGGVPNHNETTIEEDWSRHISDESFNALKESWGQDKILIPGNHPIQIFYQKLIDNTDLAEEDILYTNLYWQRSKSVSDLRIDSILEKQCKEGFLLNLETHQPESICFLGHQTHDHISKEWASVSLACGEINYPWGNSQVIKFHRMKFENFRVGTFSVPHPSRFGIGDNQNRLDSILKALNRCLD